jgi:hypothetical protein
MAVEYEYRSNADKRQSVVDLLEDEEKYDWSNREIARAAGVSEALVRSVRGASYGVNMGPIGRLPVNGAVYSPLEQAWRVAKLDERRKFVETYKEQIKVHLWKPSQPTLIIEALQGAILYGEELAEYPGVTRRLLGRNLGRLVKSGRVVKLKDGKYKLK